MLLEENLKISSSGTGLCVSNGCHLGWPSFYFSNRRSCLLICISNSWMTSFLLKNNIVPFLTRLKYTVLTQILNLEIVCIHCGLWTYINNAISTMEQAYILVLRIFEFDLWNKGGIKIQNICVIYTIGKHCVKYEPTTTEIKSSQDYKPYNRNWTFFALAFKSKDINGIQNLCCHLNCKGNLCYRFQVFWP